MAKFIALDKRDIFFSLNLVGLTANFMNGCVPHASPLACCLRGVSIGCSTISASMALNAGDQKTERISAIAMFVESIPLIAGLPGGMCWPSAVVQGVNMVRGMQPDN